MGVTASQLRAALVAVGGLGGQKWSLEQLAAEANEAMRGAGITTRQGVAAFITQCMIESAYFRAVSEYGGPNTSYAPYYGRGFIQTTHANNYRAFGAWAKSKGLVSDANYFYNNPSKLADDKWKWLTAVQYMSQHRHNLIKLANEGQIDKVGAGVHAGDAHATWYPSQSNTANAKIQRNRFKHNRQAYNALLAAGVTAPAVETGKTTNTKKEDWFDMASKQDLIDVIESTWSKGINVPYEGKKQTRNQMLIVGYTRAGKAARDAYAALAVAREVAKAQGFTDDQLDDIEKKVDSILKNQEE